MRKVFTQRLAGAGGCLGCPAGWLELWQSNSALIASYSQNVGAFCHRRRKSARGAAAAGSGRRQPGKQPRASRRRLRHICWSIPQGPGRARSREPPRAGSGQEPRIARGGQQFRDLLEAAGGGREQPAAAAARRRPRKQGAAGRHGKQGAAGSRNCRGLVGARQYIIADLLTYSPAFVQPCCLPE